MRKTLIDPKDYMHVSTAAELRGVRRQSLYYHVNAGTIRFIEIDRTVFLHREDVKNLKLRAPSKNRSDVTSSEN